MKYLVLIALFFYGLFYHITSSEFWPIAISKTWFQRASFEESMLQKPLLTLFLSVVHLLPLSDVQHIYLVRSVFTITGIAGLAVFSYFVIELTQFSYRQFSKLSLSAALALLLILLSPLIRNNFFNIRSDQVAFLLFSLFLLFCERAWLRSALIMLLLIPLFGIKEIIFLMPGAIYFFWAFRGKFTAKTIFFTGYAVVTVLVWVVALNMGSALYLADSYSGTDYLVRFGLAGFVNEAPLLVVSMVGALYIFYRKRQKLYKIAVISILFSCILLSLPQAYNFFIASILPFIFLPFLALLLQINIKPFYKQLLLTLQLIWVASITGYYQLPVYNSNFDQFRFIKTAADLIGTYKFSYLDGEGILPKQNFYPCFVSPYDDNANNSCLNRMYEQKPDVLIITNRLIFLGEDVFSLAQRDYIQIYPNFWVAKTKITSEIKAKTDLSNQNPLPIVIF